MSFGGRQFNTRLHPPPCVEWSHEPLKFSMSRAEVVTPSLVAALVSVFPSQQQDLPPTKTWASFPISMSLSAAQLPGNFMPLALSVSLPHLGLDPHHLRPEPLCQLPLWSPHLQANSLHSIADRVLLININLTWALP